MFHFSPVSVKKQNYNICIRVFERDTYFHSWKCLGLYIYISKIFTPLPVSALWLWLPFFIKLFSSGFASQRGSFASAQLLSFGRQLPALGSENGRFPILDFWIVSGTGSRIMVLKFWAPGSFWLFTRELGSFLGSQLSLFLALLAPAPLLHLAPWLQIRAPKMTGSQLLK